MRLYDKTFTPVNDMRYGVVGFFESAGQKTPPAARNRSRVGGWLPDSAIPLHRSADRLCSVKPKLKNRMVNNPQRRSG